MCFKSVILCAILSLLLGKSEQYILDKNVTQSDCEIMCATQGGQADSRTENQSCTCLLSKNIDEVDLALINKNAKLVSKTSDNRIIFKRDVSAENETTTPPPTTSTSAETTSTTETPTTTTVASEEKLEIDLNPEGIVGQAAPQRRTHNQRLVTPRRQREPRIITPEQQRILLQQMRDHLNRLAQLSDQRVREYEIEAMRGNLRQLSNTALTQTPQQRSRMRNVVEEARRRQQSLRLPHSRIVGAAAPENSTVKQQDEVESAIKEIFQGKKQRFHEIITQDPRLIRE